MLCLFKHQLLNRFPRLRWKAVFFLDNLILGVIDMLHGKPIVLLTVILSVSNFHIVMRIVVILKVVISLLSVSRIS